jgi:hypothetical protein
MGQMIELRRGVSNDPDLLRLDVGALSHRLPGIVNTALHLSTSLTCSVIESRPVKDLSIPLVC